jgi:hypothetical protein
VSSALSCDAFVTAKYFRGLFMTPNEIGQILRELGKISARQEAMEQRQVEQGADIKEVKAEVKRTNGRVTDIERREDAIDATELERRRVALVKSQQRQRWNGWFAPIITGVTTGSIMLIITLIATGKI